MANEITVNVNLTNRNGHVIEVDDDLSFSANQTTLSAAQPGYAIADTVEGSIDFQALDDPIDPAWCKVKNLDTTNFVTLGFATGVLPLKLLPGESMVFRFNEPGGFGTLYFKADTASVKLGIRCYAA